MGKLQRPPKKPAAKPKVQKLLDKYCTVEFAQNVLFDRTYLYPVAVVVIILDLIVSIFVVEYVKYTEIDWVAYMQEVGGVLNGTLDYSKLKGDTGPLVYPAGFVYIYSLLYFITNAGQNIKLAQYIFIGLYALLITLVYRVYIKSQKVPPYMLVIMSFTSYRIHSIFMLRLFNDCIAVLLFFVALNLFLDGFWSWGSFFYSVAVSVKMNILLYSPALLLAYLACLKIKDVIKQLSICAIVQLVLGAPFLLTHPLAYIQGSFDLGRVFLHQWTVNWRFLPEPIFTDRVFHITLLILHLTLLALVGQNCFCYLKNYARLRELERQLEGQLKKSERINMRTCSQLFILPLFLVNLIGIMCSRSLHYQFYVWYYHTLPYLLWCTELPPKWKLTVMGFIELAWNTYPSTNYSSATLHVCHIILFATLWMCHRKTLNA